MQLNMRQSKVLTALILNHITAPEALAQFAGVSGRTISNDIIAINDALTEFDISIKLVRNEGYCCQAKSQAQLDFLRSQLLYRSYYAPRYETDFQSRVGEIIRRLLMKGSYVRLDDIAEGLFLTKSALNQDLREVRRVLGRYQLSLSVKPHHGICVTGEEPGYRQCLVDFCRPYCHLIEPLSFLQDGYTHLNIAHDEVKRLYNLMTDLFLKADLSCPPQNLERLVITALVVRHRSKHKDHLYPLPDQLAASMTDSPVFRLAEQILTAKNRTLPHSEICYFSIILLANISFQNRESMRVYGHFYEQAKTLYIKLNRYIKSRYDLDFEQDEHFFIACVNLLLQFSARAALQLPEWEYDGSSYEIARCLPASRQLACDTLDFLLAESGYFGGRYALIAFTLLYYNSAMCVPTDRKKLRLLCIGPADGQSARSFAYKLKSQHGNYIEQLDICLPSQIAAKDLTQYDAIVTSEPEELLPKQSHLPILRLRYFMNWRDLYEFRNQIVLPGLSKQLLEQLRQAEAPPCPVHPKTPEELLRWGLAQLGLEDEILIQQALLMNEALPCWHESGTMLLLRFVESPAEEQAMAFHLSDPVECPPDTLHRLVLIQIYSGGKLDSMKNLDSILRRILQQES